MRLLGRSLFMPLRGVFNDHNGVGLLGHIVTGLVLSARVRGGSPTRAVLAGHPRLGYLACSDPLCRPSLFLVRCTPCTGRSSAKQKHLLVNLYTLLNQRSFARSPPPAEQSPGQASLRHGEHSSPAVSGCHQLVLPLPAQETRPVGPNQQAGPVAHPARCFASHSPRAVGHRHRPLP